MKRKMIFGASIMFAVILGISTAHAAPRGALSDLCAISPQFNWDMESSDSQFLGVWDGAWGENNELKHTLIVHKVKGTVASAYYATSEYKPWGAPAGCYRNKGTLRSDGTLHFEFSGAYAVVNYNLNSNDVLKGTYITGSSHTPGTFTRVSGEPVKLTGAKCVQQGLNDLGINVGTVDGQLGKKSYAGAIQYLQSDGAPSLPVLSKATVGEWCTALSN